MVFSWLNYCFVHLLARLFFCAALLYELKVPRWDFQTGRQLRTSPLYDRLDTQGARWMEKHGFERTKYFVPPVKGTAADQQRSSSARGGVQWGYC